jgi:hypothetical protein
LGRVCRGGRPGWEIPLGQDVRRMAVHGVFAQDQPVGDLLVAQALRDQMQNLHFPLREAGQVECVAGLYTG